MVDTIAFHMDVERLPQRQLRVEITYRLDVNEWQG